MTFSTRRLSMIAAGLGAVIFICVNLLGSHLFSNVRADLTQQHLYSLSQGTRTLLKEINEPLRFRFFMSSSLTTQAPQLMAFATRVRSTLEAYAAGSDGRIVLEVIDPKPFSEEEDRAVAFGLSPFQAPNGDRIFFGLAATNSTTGRATMASFAPEREAFLEYDLTRLVAELGRRGKPVVSIIDGLGLSGNPQMGKQEQQILVQMKQFFTLSMVNPEQGSLPADTRVLMVVHPQHLPQTTLFAIDQWVLKGGATMIFVDPYAESQTDMRGGPAPDASSNLEPLLSSWGVKFDTSRSVADPAFALQTERMIDGRAVSAQNLPWLALRENAFAKNEAILAQVAALVMTTAGSFETTKDGVTLSPLVSGSARAGTTDAALSAERGGDPRRFIPSFKAATSPPIIAGRLTGTLTSAFEKAPEGSDPAGAATQSTKPTNVILVGDADMLMDRNWVQVRNMGGSPVAQSFANNGDFVINAIEQMAGGAALGDLRGRGVSYRPFERIQAMEADADARYRAKEQELTQRLKETEQKLASLPRGTEISTDMLTADQVKTIEQFRGQLLSIRAELRDVQFALRSNVDSLKSWITAINVGAVPLLAGLIALIFAMRRPRKPVPQKTQNEPAQDQGH